ncbi:hypothetical protein [Streptomyces olivaceoviridis]|uniref:hypothetical protein n=1 Tax=Streptomyces olivaceoviridis TaxID=1921 RepID=UPI003701F7BE
METTVTAETQESVSSGDRSIRPVIEHALIDYGYSPETTRILLDRLIAEVGAE